MNPNSETSQNPEGVWIKDPSTTQTCEVFYSGDLKVRVYYGLIPRYEMGFNLSLGRGDSVRGGFSRYVENYEIDPDDLKALALKEARAALSEITGRLQASGSGLPEEVPDGIQV